ILFRIEASIAFANSPLYNRQGHRSVPIWGQVGSVFRVGSLITPTPGPCRAPHGLPLRKAHDRGAADVAVQRAAFHEDPAPDDLARFRNALQRTSAEP